MAMPTLVVCGMLSACACNYGMDEMVGAHDWYETWIESHNERARDNDVTWALGRLPNPSPTIHEHCPLCIERNDLNVFLEYGVGRLFTICFGCNRKYCTSAKPGQWSTYTPCQFSMECTCPASNDVLQCYECDNETYEVESMKWFDHVRLFLAGIHYLTLCIIKTIKAGIELLSITTVGIMCACINYLFISHACQ